MTVKFAGREIPKSPYSVLVEGHAGDPSKVTASGPGLQPEGVMINRPTYFDIYTKGEKKPHKDMFSVCCFKLKKYFNIQKDPLKDISPFFHLNYPGLCHTNCALSGCYSAPGSMENHS